VKATALPCPAHRRQVFRRVWPTALAVTPVGVLFGLLASQAHWSVAEVCLISLLGYSGSGQFALLPLASKEVGFFTMLLVTASINCRYLPIAYLSAARLPAQPVRRAGLAHLLGDEAYAIEQGGDAHGDILIIRASIFAAWVVSSTLGALAAGLLPSQLFGAGVNVGFPASVVLLYLSFSQLKARLGGAGMAGAARFGAIALCVALALALVAVLGPIYFWIPSILLTALVLRIAMR
jgi:predicted branched-subunit amino acid permease